MIFKAPSPSSVAIEHGWVYTSAILETLSHTRSVNMKRYIQPDLEIKQP
jgi:hypothetical protein